MIRLAAVAFALALASSAQAMPPAPVQQPDSIVTQIAEGCGPGFRMVDGNCVRNTEARHERREERRDVRRCDFGMRWVNGVCIP